MLTILFTLLTLNLTAPPDNRLVIVEGEAIRPYEAIWNATCKVESNFNPLAIGDRHLKHKSYGIVQVRRSRLSDYYNKTGIRYSERDMFDPVKAKEVFLYYCVPDIETTARNWNGGERGMQKKSTLKYWRLIQKSL